MLSKESLFALSLFPYLGFLWFLSRSPQTPRLALAGFYFLLVFVALTIPAGIYAQVHYGAQLADVDWLHGGAEVFLSISNLLVVLGFATALSRFPEDKPAIHSPPLEGWQAPPDGVVKLSGDAGTNAVKTANKLKQGD